MARVIAFRTVSAIFAIPTTLSMMWLMVHVVALAPTLMLISEIGTWQGLVASIAISIPGILYVAGVERLEVNSYHEYDMWVPYWALGQMLVVIFIINWR